MAALPRGTILGGRYEVVEPLGGGGMGAVYRARDRILEETVAVKVLRADLVGSPEMARRFRSEIKLARRVSHPNVCRIYEYGEDGPLQYISMELVEGENLKERLAREGPPPSEKAWDLAVQVAEGLSAVHAVGIVHRDLKSANIMIDARGTVRVMDFGIAKAAAPAGQLTGGATSYVLGSPEYMSPEQARGRPADLRSDVYSLGIVVFETFTGHVPFRGETPLATLLLHLELQPPLTGPEAAGLPPALVPFLGRALAKDPARRFVDGAEAAGALRRLEAESAPGTATQRVRTAARLRRSPRPGRLVGAAAVAGLAGLALVLWRSAGAPGPATMPSSPPASPGLASRNMEPTASPLTEAGPPATRPTVPSSREPAPPAPGRSPRATPAAPVVVPPVTRTPEPTPRAPTPTPTPLATATPSPAPTPAAAPQTGALLVLVRPWADVMVDGVQVGQTPLRALTLSAGPHAVVLTHPHYQPYRHKVTVRPGQTVRLSVDLATEGVRRRR